MKSFFLLYINKPPIPIDDADEANASIGTCTLTIMDFCSKALRDAGVFFCGLGLGLERPRASRVKSAREIVDDGSL